MTISLIDSKRSTAITPLLAKSSCAKLTCCTLLALLTLAQAATSYAETRSSDLFIPEHTATYNPLQHGKGKSSTYSLPTVGLSNEDLVNAADDIRNNDISLEQRALNHQWLDHENYVDDAHVGGKVLSHLFKMGFKTYWKDVRDNNYSQSTSVPTDEGDGKITRDINYNIRLNGNDVKLSVDYEF